jgi:transposase InsO family protein
VISRYELIDAEKANYPIVTMCGWLEVSKSGFYEWWSRPVSATARRREYLQVLIKKHFELSHRTYGYRRIHAALRRQGQQVGPELVRELMRELDLVPCQPRPFRPTTTVAGDAGAVASDLVGRDFTATEPGAKFVGDITYLPTGEGWLYLATAIDCYSKMVAGWSMADHVRASLVVSALDMAATNVDIAPDAVFHSDRGVQYTSAEFGAKLASLGMRRSVGRTGVCWDNAMAESFFGALKTEWTDRMRFATRADARQAIVSYIEGFYNRQRLHSGLDYKTPLEVHYEFTNQQQAA